MASISETIVIEYLEQEGFWVHQPVKYQVAARAKRPLEEIDLLAYRPGTEAADLPEPGLWLSQDLKRVNRAVFSVRGWHTDRFSKSTLEQSPELFNFVRDDVTEEARSFFQDDWPVARILVFPGFPNTPELADEALHMLVDNGVHGILTFQQVLTSLVARVDTQRNYDQSDLLQILRILKNYDLLKDAQLELFHSRRRKSRS